MKIFIRLIFIPIIFLCLQCASYANSASQYYENALQYHYKGDQKAAVIELKNALKADYNNLSARILLGKIYLDNGEAAAAEKEFKIALASGVDKSLIELQYGSALYALKRFEDVIRVINVTNKDDKVDADIHVLLGSAYARLNKTEEAKSEFLKAQALQPSSLSAKLALVGLDMSAGKLDAAEQVLITLTQEHKSEEVWFLLGEIAKLKKEPKVAKIRYTKALEFSPENLPARHALIELLLQTFETFDANIQVIELEKYWPEDPLTQYFRALVLLNQGKITESHAILTELSNEISAIDMSLVENNYELSMISAVSYYLLEQSEKARSYLNPLLLRNPNNIDLAIMLADIEIKEKNYFQAQQLLEKWRGESVQNLNFYLLLGTAYAQQERFNEAEAILTSGRTYFPNSPSLQKITAAALAYQGKYEQALQLLKKVVDGGYRSAQMMLGYILLDQGMAIEALEQAKSIIDNTEPTIAELNFYAACLIKNNRLVEAEQVFDNILKQANQFPPALINQARIFLNQGNISQARANLETVVKLNPAEFSALELLIEIYQNTGYFEQGNILLTNALEVTEAPAKALRLLINLNLAAQNIELVEQYNNQLNSIEPLNPFVIEARIKIALANNDLAVAKRSIGVLYGLSTNKPDKLERIAQYQLAIKDINGVKRTIDRLNQIKTDNLDTGLISAEYAYLASGKDAALASLESIKSRSDPMQWLQANKNIFLLEKDFTSALSVVEAQLKIATYDNLLKERIGLLSQLDRIPEAIQFVDIIIRDNPTLNEYKKIKLDLLVKSDQAESVIPALKAALKETPNDAKILNNLALLHTVLDIQSALNYIQQAHALEPEQAPVLDTYGWVLINLKRYDEALTYLRKAYLKAPRQAEINYHIALALFHLDRKQEAKLSLQKAKLHVSRDKLAEKITELGLKLQEI